uniref:Ig-like domain-containing protein n=1 Tax=Leptobrachium leishanense TaxID=445787 RepID=A0A8C5MAP5_9ANUR
TNYNHLICFMIFPDFFLDCVNCKEQVTQVPPFAAVFEGDRFIATCTYDTSNFYSLHWYKQNAGEGLSPLIVQVKSEKVQKERFTYELRTQEKLSTPSDSGTYYCALRPTLCSDDKKDVQ